jgi:hypothetical protein
MLILAKTALGLSDEAFYIILVKNHTLSKALGLRTP